MTPMARFPMPFIRRWRDAADRCAAIGCLAGVLASSALAADPDVAAAAGAQKGMLTVRMIGFRDDRGQARVTLFREPHGFPDNTNLAFKAQAAGITNHAAVVEFFDIPFGEYAIGVLHDDNGNARMDTNWMGIPREGYGVSGNPGAGKARPDFDSSRFTLASTSRTVTITLAY